MHVALYLVAVRSAITFTCLVVIALLRVTDGLICPDGCRDSAADQATSAPAHDQTSSPGDCLVCSGGVSAPVVIAVAQPVAEKSTVLEDSVPTTSRYLPPLEHPPRHI